jgi:hypothetical protein
MESIGGPRSAAMDGVPLSLEKKNRATHDKHSNTSILPGANPVEHGVFRQVTVGEVSLRFVCGGSKANQNISSSLE